MTKNHYAFSFALCITVLFSCNTEEEQIPSYIYLDTFTFSVRQHEGSAHQNLTDGWIYVNGNYYGAYELPVKIPVLEEGSSEILVFPGYRQDGRITNTFRYALLEPFKSQITLSPRRTDTIKPSSTYQPGLIFSTIENFDGLHFFTGERDNDVETQITISASSEAFEGTGSGLIELTSAHPFLFVENVIEKVIPQSGDPIILELSFKSDIPFSIGFLGYKDFRGEDNIINAGLLPKKEWTKVYFDFRQLINKSNSDTYKLAITASYHKDTLKPVQRIFLDNIKVIHR
jgi:hypothetical protein